MAAALLSIPAMAEGLVGNAGVDVLGRGIFETNGAAIKFFEGQDTNIDNLVIGNDRAISKGFAGIFPWDNNGPGIATNNLEVKKNQDSGACECCKAYGDGQPCDQFSMDGGPKQSDCRDWCIKVNIENLKIGDRTAMAFDLARSTNNVKVVTNQQ